MAHCSIRPTNGLRANSDNKKEPEGSFFFARQFALDGIPLTAMPLKDRHLVLEHPVIRDDTQATTLGQLDVTRLDADPVR